MRYDIVPIKNKYRGMERMLSLQDLWNTTSKKESEYWFEMYCFYIEWMELEKVSEVAFKRVVNLFHNLPLAFLDETNPTVFNIGMKPISNEEAIQYASSYVEIMEKIDNSYILW